MSMQCLWFCFKNILQADLDMVKDNWNSYYIRGSHYNTVPGRPNELYYIPEIASFQECKCAVSEEQLDNMDNYNELQDDNSIFDEYFRYVLESQKLLPPSTLQLYNNLMNFPELPLQN